MFGLRVDILCSVQANYRIAIRGGFPPHLKLCAVRSERGRSAIYSTRPLTMTTQRLSYTYDSTLETVDNAEQTASQIATEAGFEEDVVMQIAMAVREAAINAVLHG